MEVRILGPVEVLDDDGRLVDVGGTRPRTLLVVLALAHGRAVPAEQLLEDVWNGGQAPARNNLQVHVSRLRRVLGDDRITTRGGGYALDLPHDALDAAQFDRLAAEGRAAMHAGDMSAAATILREALALWRGAALADFVEDEFARPVITRLEESRLTALEDRLDADLALGRHAELIGELEALVLEHPLRERFWAQLMTALYRCDRQADALRAYQRARTVLVEELGIEPGVELQRVEAAVLAHDPALAATAAPSVEVAEPPVDVTRPQPDSNLPVPAAPLIGRTTEVDATASLVRQHRIVTVVGPGGVGKTRVAIEAARSLRREFDEGVQLVELAPVGDAADVSTAVASALGVEAEVGAGASTKPLERLSEFLAGRRMLLVLDNCEHVVGEAARVVEHLAGRCPELHVLATSREPLMIGGEALWPLAPLELDSAVALFMTRAHAVAPAFETTPATSATVRDICDRLDCLPLAIELAAARMRAFTPRELYSRLDDRFRLLTVGARTAFPRQQTLRAVTDWSYDLLFENERRVFERVSVFASWFTLAAAEAVCADETVAEEEVAELLARLIDKSLLVSVSNAHGVKYRLLQTLAQYGRERLRARGDDDATRTRHARYVAGYVEVPDAVHGDLHCNWFLKVSVSLDDVRAATEWAIATRDADLACALTAGLGWFWNMGGRLDDTWRWLVAAVALGETEDPTRRVRALAWAGAVGIVPDTEQSLAYGWEAVELARRVGDPSALALATTLHASSLSDFFHRTAVPIVLFEESRQAYEAVGDAWSLAMAAIVRGAILLVQGDFDRAFPELRSGADQFGALDNAWGRSIALRHLADVATTRGRYIEAISALRDAISGLRAVGAVGVSSGLTARLAYLYALQGDHDEAEVWFEQALADAEKQRYVPTFALTYNLRGIAWRRQQRYDDAEQCHRRALALYYERGAHAGVSLTLASLGYLAEMRGDVVTAEAHHRASLDAACDAEDPRAQALALEGLAGVASLRGDDEAVGRLLGAANALREATGGPLVSTEYDDVARAVARVSRPEIMTAAYTVAARDPAAVIAAVRDAVVLPPR